MSSELLQTLKKYISQVIDSFYLPLPELGIISIQEGNYFVRLVDQDILIPFHQCLFSSLLMEEQLTLTFLNQYPTTISQEHNHLIPENTNDKYNVLLKRTFQDKDHVLVIRLKKGEQFLILCKVISSARL